MKQSGLKVGAVILLIIFSNIYATLSVGQTVPKVTFKTTNIDQNGKSVIFDRDLYAMIDQGKLVYIDLFFTTCPPCNAGAPPFNALWEKYKDGGKLYSFQGSPYSETADDLNSKTWRKKFSPNLTVDLANKSMFSYHSWGNNYYPFYIVIGKDYKVKHASNNSPSEANLIKWMNEMPVSSLEESDIAKNTLLASNYPNPFNPTTTITFTLQENSQVKLTVFNAQGQKVKELLNQTLTAGQQQINFDGTNLQSGLYYYKISAGNQQITNKMILLK